MEQDNSEVKSTIDEEEKVMRVEMGQPKLTHREKLMAIGIWLGIGLFLNLLSIYLIAMLFGGMALWVAGVHSFIFAQIAAVESAKYKRTTINTKIQRIITQQVEKFKEKFEQDAISNKTGAGDNKDNTQV